MHNAYPRVSSLVLLWLFACISSIAFGQTPAEVLEQAGTLQSEARRRDVVTSLRAIERDRRDKADQIAAARHWPRRMVLRDGTVRELAEITDKGPLYFTTHNADAAISTGANLLQAAPFNLTGAGLRVGLWDGGAARVTHDEFNGRVTLKEAVGENGHSTHVAGTIAAAGVQLAARGMAPAVLIDSYDFNNDKSEMTAAGASYPGEPGKIYLSNHSYGFVSGWNYTGGATVTWDWWGAGTTAAGVEDDFGKYSANARDTDALAVSLPYYLIFRSAGNDRTDNPAPGTNVALTPNGATPVVYDPATHPAGDGAYKGGGYDTIGFDAVAKNAITVGSVGDAVNNGIRSPANGYMSSYSSWGPTDDGRIKPDVVANGEALYSSYSGSDSSYAYLSGTSMSTPNATGSAALLIQYFDQLFPGHALRASTLKALLIHTADDLGAPGPDYQYGWGLINVKAAADLLHAYRANAGTRKVIEDRVVTTTRTLVTHSFTWDGSSPIRATLCWTDPAGTAATTGDSRTARLVNNLNLQIVGPDGATYSPYVMPYVGDWTVGMLGAPAITGVNNTDNVEQVYLAAPSGAGQCQARVTFTGTLTGGAQQYSLILSGGAASSTAPAPGLSTVSPNATTGGAMTLTLTGSNFLLGASVKLKRAGAADVAGSGIEVFGDGLKVRIDASGMPAGMWDVVVTNPDGQAVTLPGAFVVPAVARVETLEAGLFGWSHTAVIGTDSWATTTASSNSPTHSYFSPCLASRTESHLISPAFEVPATATNMQLSFWHQYSFQTSNLDAGVMELSVNGGTYFGINDAGSGVSFASNGYTGTISSSGTTANRNPLAGLSGWVGSTNGWQQTVINITDTAKFAGKTLRVRWRLGTNNSTASTGWNIDDLALTGANFGNLTPWISTASAATPATVTGTSTQLSVLAGDDAGEAPLIYTWSVNDEPGAPITFSANGTNAAKNTTATFSKAGTFTFTVTVTDAGAKTVINTVNVQVNPTLSAFVVSPKSASIRVTKTQTFTASGKDQFGNTLTNQPTVAWSTSGGGTINASGVYTAGIVAGGPYTVTATSGVVSGQGTISILPNNVPVAGNDGFSGNEDFAINGNVLSNDSDADNDPLSAIIVTNAAHGNVTLNANGAFTYTPVLNYFGTDAFTYKANDGLNDSLPANVSLVVNPVNDAPTAVNDSAPGDEDTVFVGNVLSNDTDPDGDVLSAILVADVSHGTLVLNASGAYSYTPASNYFGADSFTYRANDGLLNSNIATVTITIAPVNDAPVAVNDAVSGNENTVLNGNVLTNDTDVEGNSLTALLVTDVAHGTLELNANGTFSYTPAQNYAGPDSFSYRANDGAANSNVATVTLTVNPVNDAPVAVDDAVAGNEDTVITGNVLANDSDVDGNVLSAILLADVSHGAVSLNANGTFSYTPAQNYAGPDSFTYRANDGTVNSNVATVTITVIPVNDAPVAVNDTVAVSEDTVASGNVLTNDSDVEGNPLSAALVTDVAHGALALNANGTFNYTPAQNYTGQDSFTYRANDGTTNSNIATVTITVNPVNDAPVAVNDAFAGNEDAVISGNVLGNDSDVEGNALSAALVSDVVNGTLILNADGSFTYTPGANYAGNDSFLYRVNDGALDSNVALVTLTVNPVNDAPAAANDGFAGNEDTVISGNVLSNDTDVEGAVLTAALVANAGHGTVVLNPNGTFNYTPAQNYAGADSFTYRASDGVAESNVATVTITLIAVNDPPLAVGDAFAGNEDTAIAGNVLSNDSDVDNANLTAAVVTEPTHGVLALNADGSFTYTPAQNYSGADSFTYKASDGAADSNTVAVNITVSPVNDPPLATNDSFAGDEDTVITGNVASNDTDVDGPALSVAVVAQPLHGTLVLNPSGAFSYTPSPDFFGADSFTYKASDGTADSAVASVTILVNPVNDAPTAVSDVLSGNQGVPLTGTVLGNDTDIDGNVLTAWVVTGPSHGTLSLNTSGAVSYTPSANFIGTDTFTYKANDGTADSNVVTVTLNVAGELFSTWQSQHFSPEEIQAGLAADLFDFDHDGLFNLVEYALGTDPRVPNAGPAPQIVPDALGDKRLTFVYDRPVGLPGISYGVEATSDFVTWQEIAAAEVTGSSGTETVVVRDTVKSSEEKRRFMRLRVRRVGE